MFHEIKYLKVETSPIYGYIWKRNYKNVMKRTNHIDQFKNSANLHE